MLVNQYGYPVVRCLCGNPLTPPVSGKKYRYVGPQWQGFNQTTIIIYVAPPGNVPNVPTSVPSGGQQQPKLGSVAGNYTLHVSNAKELGDAKALQISCTPNGTMFTSSVVENGNQVTLNIPTQPGSTAITLTGTIDPLGHFDIGVSESGGSVKYSGNVDPLSGTWDGEYVVNFSSGGKSGGCSVHVTANKA